MPQRLIVGISLIAVATAVLFYYFFVENSPKNNYQVPTYSTAGFLLKSSTSTVEKVSHLPTPEPLRAVYMTSCVAGTPYLRDRLLKLVKETELNAVVVDLKDYTGTLSFKPEDETLVPYATSGCPIGNLKDLVENLHRDHIYIIGRITVFQDPAFTKRHPDTAVKKASNPDILWADKKGINYIDPGSKKAWDHIARIAEDAYQQGVDELNFDYIRFPSDGNMRDISFPLSGTRSKPEVLESFFAYLNQRLKPSGMMISADVFGMTTSSYVDVGIGQIWERTLPHFDYVAPMIYPSHYYNGFSGFANPNDHPYEVIHTALAEAVKRTVATSTTVQTLGGSYISSTTPALYTKPTFNKGKIRPWLQDFDYPVPYTPAMVRAQMKATYDLGLTSWMMWDPTNTYTREVYEPVI